MNAAEPDRPGPPPSSAPRILMVEHDVLVRTVVAAYLRECGYDVVETSGAEEAVAVLRSDVRIDVVFSEVSLPGKFDGFALAQWVRRERPGAQVILTSSTDRTAKAAGNLCETGPILRKPYGHAELARRIRSLTSR